MHMFHRMAQSVVWKNVRRVRRAPREEEKDSRTGSIGQFPNSKGLSTLGHAPFRGYHGASRPIARRDDKLSISRGRRGPCQHREAHSRASQWARVVPIVPGPPCWRTTLNMFQEVTPVRCRQSICTPVGDVTASSELRRHDCSRCPLTRAGPHFIQNVHWHAGINFIACILGLRPRRPLTHLHFVCTLSHLLAAVALLFSHFSPTPVLPSTRFCSRLNPSCACGALGSFGLYPRNTYTCRIPLSLDDRYRRRDPAANTQFRPPFLARLRKQPIRLAASCSVVVRC